MSDEKDPAPAPAPPAALAALPAKGVGAVALIEALAKLLPGIAILIALWLFHGDISEFLKRTKSFKGVGLELEAFDSNLRTAAKAMGIDTGQSLATKAIWKRFEQLATVLPTIRILWVDDNPENNFPIRRNLTRYGIQVDIAQSNAGAIVAIRHHDYDLIVSDVFRDDANAEFVNGVKQSGIDLAKQLRQLGYDSPLLFYSAHYKDVPDTVERAIATNRPSDLLSKIADIIDALYPDITNGEKPNARCDKT